MLSVLHAIGLAIAKDTINEYCQQHFSGKFECVLAEGKGRTAAFIAQQIVVLYCRPCHHILHGRIMISKVRVAQGDLLFEATVCANLPWLRSAYLQGAAIAYRG